MHILKKLSSLTLIVACFATSGFAEKVSADCPTGVAGFPITITDQTNKGAISNLVLRNTTGSTWTVPSGGSVSTTICSNESYDLTDGHQIYASIINYTSAGGEYVIQETFQSGDPWQNLRINYSFTRNREQQPYLYKAAYCTAAHTTHTTVPAPVSDDPNVDCVNTWMGDNYPNHSVQMCKYDGASGITCILSNPHEIPYYPVNLTLYGGYAPPPPPPYTYDAGVWDPNTIYQVKYNPTLYPKVHYNADGKDYVGCWYAAGTNVPGKGDPWRVYSSAKNVCTA